MAENSAAIPSDHLPNGKPIHEGLDFLAHVWEQEDECEGNSDQLILKLGVKAPQCLERLGTVLSLLDRLSSCWWGCQNGDHLVEYLVGRAVNLARAAVRLMRFGFYDEALGLSRSIGEIANLLCLFFNDRESFAQWKAEQSSGGRSDFTPVRVRLKIEALNTGPVPVDKDHYGLLSEISTHVHPRINPQAHNLLGIPTAGGQIQESGIVVSLNEISLPITFIALYGTHLSSLDKDDKISILTVGRGLAESLGGWTLKKWLQYQQEYQSAPEAQELISLLKMLQKIGQQDSEDLSTMHQQSVPTGGPDEFTQQA